MNVRLPDVEARVVVEHFEHLDTLVGELRVVASGQQSGTAPVASEIADLVDGILGRYARVKDETYLRARDVLARGEERFSIEVDLPEEAAADAERLLEALERADVVCRDERLLVLPANPRVVEFRRWALPQVARQLRGAPPASP